MDKALRIARTISVHTGRNLYWFSSTKKDFDIWEDFLSKCPLLRSFAGAKIFGMCTILCFDCNFALPIFSLSCFRVPFLPGCYSLHASRYFLLNSGYPKSGGRRMTTTNRRKKGTHKSNENNFEHDDDEEFFSVLFYSAHCTGVAFPWEIIHVAGTISMATRGNIENFYSSVQAEKKAYTIRMVDPLLPNSNNSHYGPRETLGQI